MFRGWSATSRESWAITHVKYKQFIHVKIAGTQKFNLIGVTNEVLVKRAMQKVDNLERGSWALSKACNADENLSKLHKEHNNSQRNTLKSKKMPFIPLLTNLVEKAGLIIFKDKKMIVFCNNDLAFTPSKDL